MNSGMMVRALASADRSPTIHAVLSCERTLCDSGFDAPNWEDLAEGASPHQDESQEEEPNQPRHGWQKVASMHLESKFISDALWPTLSAQERALMRSQCGPLSSVAFTAFPTSRLTRFDFQPFRVLLLRRLHLPLPLSARACRCASSRRLWPPPVCMCNFWGCWEEGFPSSCEGLQRGRSQGAHQCDGQGLGPLASRQGRQTGGWRLSPMASRCMGERSWPSTPHLCHHWHETVQSSGVPTARTEQFRWKRGGKNAPTRSWQEWVAGPRLSSSLLRLAVVGPRNLDNSCYLWHPPKPSLHRICSSRRRKRAGFTGGVACWGAPRPNPSPYRCWMVQRPELVQPQFPICVRRVRSAQGGPCPSPTCCR